MALIARKRELISRRTMEALAVLRYPNWAVALRRPGKGGAPLRSIATRIAISRPDTGVGGHPRRWPP